MTESWWLWPSIVLCSAIPPWWASLLKNRFPGSTHQSWRAAFSCQRACQSKAASFLYWKYRQHRQDSRTGTVWSGWDEHQRAEQVRQVFDLRERLLTLPSVWKQACDFGVDVVPPWWFYCWRQSMPATGRKSTYPKCSDLPSYPCMPVAGWISTYLNGLYLPSHFYRKCCQLIHAFNYWWNNLVIS